MGVDQKQKKNKQNSNFLIFVVLIALFIINAIKFINAKGSDLPILSYLFNMVVIVFILVYIYHAKDLEEKKDEFMKQTHLDEYFNEKKTK